MDLIIATDLLTRLGFDLNTVSVTDAFAIKDELAKCVSKFEKQGKISRKGIEFTPAKPAPAPTSNTGGKKQQAAAAGSKPSNDQEGK
jgi:hypothetical protein